MPVGVRSRRETFERALRAAALAQAGVTLVRGHADRVLERDGRAAGLLVDGSVLEADLVVDASGRSGRVTRALRPGPLAGGSCGMAYVDREYQLLPGAEPGPLMSPIAWQGDFVGYQVLVFLHEHGIFSVLLVRPTDADPVLRRLREDAVFEAVCRAIPALATWTDPERARPISATLAGGELKNAYRGQTREDGRLVLPGLLFVGDSVCTTTPIFGRGVTTTVMQVAATLRLLEEHGADLEAAGLALDAWNEEQMRPWVEDHVAMDRDTVRRWGGGDVDPARLPSDLVLIATARNPAIGQHTAAYLSMTGLPSSLDPARPLARAVYESGWRPQPTPGPTRDELVGLVRATAA
jgi:2-polyprenyl-6-methoxyphenol hydroxylase-like FAD-dependent oxidoreductase